MDEQLGFSNSNFICHIYQSCELKQQLALDNNMYWGAFIQIYTTEWLDKSFVAPEKKPRDFVNTQLMCACPTFWEYPPGFTYGYIYSLIKDIKIIKRYKALEI